MHLRSIIRIIGILIMSFSFIMIAPFIVSLIYSDGEQITFIKSFLVSFFIGGVCWFSNREYKQKLHSHEGFFIVVAFWFVLGSIGTLPLLWANSTNMGVADAAFESFSALTTTGATVMSGLDSLPKAILFHRQFLQFLGGMGIIILAVAILPFLDIGRTQLYKAESSGPMKDQKILPHIADISKLLWSMYAGLLLICTASYWLAGMSFFDALTHSFSTLSNGGFSTHDDNLAYFNSSTINIIATVFMLITGCNFSVHMLALMNFKKGKVLKIYLKDEEFRFFILSQLIFSIIFSIGLWISQDLSLFQSFQLGATQLASMRTNSGFTLFDMNQLPGYLSFFALSIAILGGCAGSTAGGIKAIRCLLLWLQLKKELKQLIHPNIVNPIKLNREKIPSSVLESVWAFIIIFILVFFLCTFAAILCGMTVYDAFFAVWTTITNTGPGLGITSLGFADVPDGAKYVFVFSMIAGRLEFFALLVLFTPSFWKR
ncbi:TrkH family potassium uptake protein [Otariodibacter sp.]|uniref:TrkH family potassium uptake protein n=1 Tax=Otariodibacter sp. TaxID=3030919 RepID=UPI00260AC117|nr:TrkH family potassium uptake protein [Otariodibacter sp.]